MGRSRGAALMPFAAAIAAALWADVARADEVDACIAAAEQSQVQRRDAHLRAAQEKLVLCARDACPRAIQKDCKRWLGEVEAAMPTVVIRVIDASGGEVVDARVLVDGEPRADSLNGRALAVDPGEHLLRVEAGARVVAQRIVIRQGERDRLLSLQLPAAAVAAPRSIPPVAWVLGGVGVAALTTGVIFWAAGRSQRTSLYATCGVTHDCAESAVDSARSKLVVGDVLFGAGLAAALAATWWALSASPAPRAPVSVSPVAGGALMSWRATF